ncbi:ras GTPase-activating protein 3-like isoform X2 [Lineus longissimus]|uniref:ras GTPase-activating protein 3-like isoform X2 n=1 Tax=Lineus longissimus TaxID=88925 RepID=UPI002B4C87E4
MATSFNDVRIKETLRIRIAEGRNLCSPAGLTSTSTKDTYCKVTLDQEEIFRTAIVEKTLSPFYGEDFQCDVPKQFRFLSCYVLEKAGGHMHFQDKVIGKVTLKRDDIQRHHGKDSWFQLQQVEPNTEVQGKIHLEVRFEESVSGSNSGLNSHSQQRLAVRVLECNNLNVTNGACNPYAVVSFSLGKTKQRPEVRRTNVKKKMTCPHFDETFIFDFESKGQNLDRNAYSVEDLTSAELNISIYHDEMRVSREVLGSIWPGVFLGGIKIQLKDLDCQGTHRAWYFLQPKENGRQSQPDLGALRLKITFTTDHVFHSMHYTELKNLILRSPNVQPVTSSIAYILGEIADKEEVAQPLVRVFLHEGKLIHLIKALAQYEITNTSDPNTIFRGNSLLTKCIDELMKLVGHQYLHDTIKATVDAIFIDAKPCEIDPTRLKDGERVDANMQNLKGYVEQTIGAISDSGLVCPTSMCEVFFALKEAAMKHRPDHKELRYQVVSGFIFLRFFAPAILGPRLFQLRSATVDAPTHRKLTLVSKSIQSLGNLVSSKSPVFGFKEEYMVPLFQHFCDSHFIESVRNFLEIISSATRAHSKSMCIEVPVVLKEGYLIKRAQGRKKFGVKNFKRRYFVLTNHELAYSREKGEEPLLRCRIPIEEILAVERLEEEAFKMKYMFQVVQPERALYMQATNCVEEKEWTDILSKVCVTNRNRLKEYHPAAYLNGHWLCCKATDQCAQGCAPVTGGLPPDIKIDIDLDLELERMQSLFVIHTDKLDFMQDACGSMSVYTGENSLMPMVSCSVTNDPKTCFESLNELQKMIIGLEQEHKNYHKHVQRQTILGSEEKPIGDEDLSKFAVMTRL